MNSFSLQYAVASSLLFYHLWANCLSQIYTDQVWQSCSQFLWKPWVYSNPPCQWKSLLFFCPCGKSVWCDL